MNKKFKYILEERLRYMLTWQKECLEYFKHQQIQEKAKLKYYQDRNCLLYTSPSPRDNGRSRMPSSA